MAAETMTVEQVEEIRALFKIGSPGRIDALCDLALAALRSQAEPAVEIEVFESSVANKQFTAVSAKLLDKTFPAGKHFLYAAPPEARPEGQKCPKCGGTEWADYYTGRALTNKICRNAACNQLRELDAPSAQREALERAAKAICESCAAGIHPEFQEDPSPQYWHGNSKCDASAIYLLPSAGRAG